MRLALSYAALLGLFTIVLLLPVTQIRKMTDLSTKFAQIEMQSLLHVQALSLSTENISRALLQMLTVPRALREPEYAAVDATNRKIDTLITSLEQSLDDAQQLQNLRSLKEKRQIYQDYYLDTVNQLEQDGQDAAKATFIKQVQPALTAMLQESQILLNREQALIQQHQSEAQKDFERTGMLVAILSALAVVVAALLAWLTTRSVVRPLARMETSALRIAQGDYNSRVPETKTEEVARVGEALNAMAQAIGQREKEIEHLAYYDALTDLPNRTLMLRQLADAVTTQSLKHQAVLLMDLARLKTINETLGFDSGDNVICEVARRLALVIAASPSPEQYYLARLAGGAFAILCHQADKALVENLHQRIDRALADPFRCGPHSIDIGLVYGFVLSGDDAMPIISLIRNAEVALYAAKRSAVEYAWYSDAQEASRLSHLSLVSDLRSAVKNSELQMWLQPKFKLETGAAYGFEALVRWQHPQRGFISPVEFVPFAERSGYIGMITLWMLEQAIRTLASWRDTHPQLSIAVNVSTHDLRDRQFPDRIAALLRQYNVAPQRLKLEITESGLMEDPDSTIHLLEHLRDTGLALSIDDFGTGYSSLSYLQRLPVSELKIDRSFVVNIDQLPTTQRLVKTVIEMGHGLGLSVIAEGIETQAERDTLLALSCDAMQGYFASRPLHGDGLQRWLSALGETGQR